jgi:Leucine-rich repeat (LRR) protein
MTKVNLFQFESNRFTGTIPSSISKLTQIRNLFLNTNSLTGILPSELLQISSLQVLLLHNNKLSGSLDFGSSRNSSLSYSIIDISNNRLGGDLPFYLFKRAKNLTVFSASSNCFQNSIPVSICDSYRLENLFLSSLSSECKGSNILGSIPSCIFKMPNLQSLYLSSNKLSGSIPSGILVDSPKLVNLSVSYNNLRGTIPETLVTNMLALLDVGNNKISGTVSNAYNINNRSAFISSSSRALELNDNRISGTIPVASVNQYQKVSILRGNLFGCEEKIPSGKDDFEGIIICGSRDLDRAIYFLCSTIFLFVVYYLVKHPRFMAYIPFQQLFELISKINNWVNSIDTMLDENDKFNNTKSFMRCIREVERIILYICISYTSVILILIPTLKSFPEYSIHFAGVAPITTAISTRIFERKFLPVLEAFWYHANAECKPEACDERQKSAWKVVGNHAAPITLSLTCKLNQKEN